VTTAGYEVNLEANLSRRKVLVLFGTCICLAELQIPDNMLKSRKNPEAG
jgi:hypothetical protein